MPHALIIDDDRRTLDELIAAAEREGFSTQTAMSLHEAREALAQCLPELVLTELVLSDGSGLELVEEVVSTGGHVVLITAHSSVDTAVEALRRGATDYLTKPLDEARLRVILVKVVRTIEERQENASVRDRFRQLGRFGPLVGASAAMKTVYDQISRVAPTEATVCIVGDSGTGKELVAQALHELSRRRREPFVPLNCGAVTPSLIESTLFGHEKGSFTGADRQHRGVFEQASGGTLFLDEVTEMPIELQVKLLRVLETGTVSRIGGETLIAIDVRVIVATNRDPERAVAKGQLREDLWYRLKVFPIKLPGLRERNGDVTVLAEHFLAELNASAGTGKRWSAEALHILEEYAWPGNVRELKNLVHRAYILADSKLTHESFAQAMNSEQISSYPNVDLPLPEIVSNKQPDVPLIHIGAILMVVAWLAGIAALIVWLSPSLGLTLSLALVAFLCAAAGTVAALLGLGRAKAARRSRLAGGARDER